MDDDLASGVWEKMDEADGRSPLPSCSIPCLGGNRKAKSPSEGQQSGDEAASVTDMADGDGDNSLLWRMWRVTGSLVMAQGVWQLVATLTEFLPSVAMQQIIDFVSSYDKNGDQGKVTGKITLFVTLLFVAPVVQGIADGRNFHLGRRIGCRVS